MRRWCLSLLLFSLCAGIGLPVRADELAKSGREIVAKYLPAMVNVRFTYRVAMTYNEKETVRDGVEEIAGVVVDPSGLVAVSLAQISPPSQMLDALAQTPNVKFSFTVSDLKVLLGDEEKAVTQVGQDADLDVAFLRLAEAPKTPLPSLDLAKAVQPGLLDPILVMYRLGASADNALKVSLDRLEAIVQRPRLYYLPGAAFASVKRGSPVFTPDGRLVGLMLLRVMPKGSTAPEMDVVIPAASIAEAMRKLPAPGTADNK